MAQKPWVHHRQKVSCEEDKELMGNNSTIHHMYTKQPTEPKTINVQPSINDILSFYSHWLNKAHKRVKCHMERL